MSLRHPAEDEKRPPRVVTRQQVQETRHTPGHPGLVAVPIDTTDSRLERRYVEVLLDIDAEVVGDHVTLPVQRMCPMAREAGGRTGERVATHNVASMQRQASARPAEWSPTTSHGSQERAVG